MDDFLILLQAKLDEAKSKENLNGSNGDIEKLQSQLDTLKLQVEINPDSIKNITEQLSKILNQPITLDNIKIGNGLKQEISSTVKDIKKDISGALGDLKRLNANNIIKDFNLNRASIGEDVKTEIRSLVTEINSLGIEAAKTNADPAWESLIEKVTELGKLSKKYGKIRANAGLEDAKRFAEYFEGKVISTGYKSSGLSGTDFSVSQLKKDLRGMHVKFDATKKEAIELDSIWEEMCQQTGRMDLLNITNAQDQLRVVIEELSRAKSLIHGEEGLIPHPDPNGYLNTFMNSVEKTRDVVVGLEKEISTLAQQESQSSSTVTNTILQNEEKKQQAYQETERIKEQLANNGNIIQNTDFSTSFRSKEEAEQYFKTISNIVSVQGKLGNNKNLESFIVEVKNAEGVVEKLRYHLNDASDAFVYMGGSVNNAGVEKQIDAINAKVSRLRDTFEGLKSKYSDLNSANPIKEDSHISDLEKQYKKVEQAISAVKNSDSATFASMTSNAEKEIKALQRMGEEFKRAETISMRMNGSDISSGLAQAQERFQKLKANSSGFEQMTETIQKLDAAIATVGDKSSLKTFIDQLRVAEAQLDRVKAETKAMNQINKIQPSIDTGGYESKVESLIAKTRQWTDENGNARISTTALSTALDNLGKASTALVNNNSIENQKALIAAEKELDTQVKTVTNSVKSMNAELAKDSAVSSLHNQIQKFYDDNGAAHRKWGSQLKQMLNETASGAEVTKERIIEIKTAFNNVASAAQQAGKVGKTWFQSLKDATKFLTYWTSPTFITMKAISEVKQGISTVKALDTALVDLKKTTTMTSSELEDFYYSSNKVAKQMGVTTEEIINQAAAWSRLGFSSEAMATKMAKYSSMFASISPGLDLDFATDGLVSTMKAFSIGLDNADDVVDGIMSKINIIGNSKALNNSDIVDFLTRSSSALASANNSIEESIAMGEAIVEITRDAAGAGQVMKTTSMRIRGYDEDVEAYTEELENLKGEIADLTKTAKTPGGISLFTDETKETYKSTYKILEEISQIWDELTDKNQANSICLYVQKCA